MRREATLSDAGKVRLTIPEPAIENAAVVHANHHQFASEEAVELPLVLGRSLVWCIAGRGEISTCGETFPISPGLLLVLPWGHDIHYRPRVSDPFLIGTVHLIPDHDRDVAIAAQPSYGTPGRPGGPHRRDVHWPGFDAPRLFSGRSAAPLIRLGEVAIEQLPEWDCNQVVMRTLGVLMARAVIGLTSQSPTAQPVPSGLIRMQEYARSHLYAHLTTATLADVGHCSVVTAERQFRRHTGLSPMNWIREERLQLAARLLRTSNRRVGEISAITGFRDPFYFARVFRNRFGAAPSYFSRRYAPSATEGRPVTT
jgi:AraC-like DNA-binding protein